jgi:sugar O-acyltransferase (sialic acid O-acetyltransferase NeuD family)
MERIAMNLQSQNKVIVNKKPRILLFGAGPHVNICIDIIKKAKLYNIVGIIDSEKSIGTIISGFKILGRQEKINQIVKENNIDAGLISIGDNWSRKIVFDYITNEIPDFQFINAIHPSIIIGENVKIGYGVVIMAGCILNSNSTIGNLCFIGTRSNLEQDCTLNNYASLSAGIVMGDEVIIGKHSAITLGVTIMDRLIIGENTVVGSGSLVTKDLPDNVLAYGNPAKIIRNRKKGERFLKSGHLKKIT